MHYIVSPPEGHGHLALTSREVTNNWCQSVSEEMSPTEQGESKGEGRPPTLLPHPDGDECMKGYSITATSKQIANSDRCCVPRYRTRGTQSYMWHMCQRGLHACRQEDSQQLSATVTSVTSISFHQPPLTPKTGCPTCLTLGHIRHMMKSLD